MRITIRGFGRRLLDLQLMAPLRRPGPVSAPAAPDCDPHGTLAAQVEQGSEPAPGFGFRGSTTTIVCGDPPGTGGSGGGGGGGGFSGDESVRITVT